jgi:hypothetical protein
LPAVVVIVTAASGGGRAQQPLLLSCGRASFLSHTVLRSRSQSLSLPLPPPLFLPRKFLLSRRYPFGISAVVAAAATADANNDGDVSACRTYSSSEI